MGYIAGKFLHSSRDTIAQLLFVLITPVIIYNGVINTNLDSSIILVPLLTFAISSLLCLLFYYLSKWVWKDKTRNLMAITAGSGNTGYFGLPVALMLFDNQGEGIYIMAMLGVTLYENTLGFYMLAKGTNTSRECFLKLLKVPAIYGFLAGLLCKFLNWYPPYIFDELIDHMKGTYTVLGMMVIGLGLAGVQSLKIDFKFIGMTFFAKFAAWPLATLLVILVDAHYIHFFDPSVYPALLLISLVPLAANTIVLASILHNHPEKSATAVILSTVFALGYTPLMTTYMIGGGKSVESSETAFLEKMIPAKKPKAIDY
jgi:predicted permease